MSLRTVEDNDPYIFRAFVGASIARPLKNPLLGEGADFLYYV